MGPRTVHTVFWNGYWFNELEGAWQALGAFDTKEEAVEAGRREAVIRQVHHVIHNEDDQIGETNSYGNDDDVPPGGATRSA